ncbi:MAG: Fe-S cluster assembly protein SufB [Calditrichaeota bacterium]|nr:Fe-S cluster assembly protein SufB [Calditrichota bacterium]
MSNSVSDLEIGSYERYGFHQPEKYLVKMDKGLSRHVVEEISEYKNEPSWMREFRLKALDIFLKFPMPTWGADLSGVHFDDIHYYVRPTEKPQQNWDEVPEEIKDTFVKLGIPEAERKFLAGVGAQYESEMVYHSLQKQWEEMGVIFLDTDTGLRQYPDLFREYFAKVVPLSDNKLAALNSAVWSGGSFIYIPPGVHVTIPLQAYFRINAQNMGQFERTLIIADEGSNVHYVEGCTAPVYSSDSLHAAVVECFAKKGARLRYTTIQNWSRNVYNLVTKRAVAEEDAIVEWVDCNLGSKTTMKYPAVFLKGRGARADILSVAYAGSGQHIEAGSKVIHAAPHTTSVIVSKSISRGGGRTSYRGLLKVLAGAVGAKSNVRCDALLMDEESRSDTYPYMDVKEEKSTLGHEATVSKIADEQLFYLMTRGLSQSQATALIVQGFIEPVVKELPMEYALEMNRLIQLQMEGSVG